jgi:glycosyltransferase involved in cell wall biosynthesis
MLIGIDGNEANTKLRVGSGVYAYNLIKQLYRSPWPHRYLVYLKKPPLSDLPPISPHWTYSVFGPKFLWTRLALPLHLFLGSAKPDLFYSPSHYLPLISPVPSIATIHDVGYLKYPQQFTPKDLHQLRSWTKHSIKQANRLITVSEFTKREIHRIYRIPENKITIVPNGVEDPPKKIAANHYSHPYFLSLGTLKPSKNLLFLINAFARFSRSHPEYLLVIAGKKGWLYDELYRVTQRLNLSAQVIFTGYVNSSQKWSLIKHAVALILPSLYEGFGIPALEAMKAGTPTIVSRIPALTEVCGAASLFINPHQLPTLTLALSEILRPSLRRQLIKLGLTQSQKYCWKTSAKLLLNLFTTLKPC